MLTRLKHAVRDQPVLRDAALRAGALVRSLGAAPAGLHALCYHHVRAEAADGFRAQIRRFKAQGRFVSADEAADRLESGRAEAGGRLFLLTLDDGYADNRDVALPILVAEEVPAILFAVSGWLRDPPPSAGRPDGYMTEADLLAWRAAGLDVGSHSASHAHLSGLDEEAVRAELAGSREALGALLGEPVRHFACPWGVAGRDFRVGRDPMLASACGYRTFFTTRRGYARSAADLLAMPRHVLEPEWPLHAVEALLGGWRFRRG